MIEWFRRLGDVPGVGYLGDPHVRRSGLSAHATVPERFSYMVDGKQYESLMWPTPDGTTSASPAARHSNMFQSRPSSDPIKTLLQRLGEVLELPGIPSDYHFAIQGCVDHLWKRRRQDPGILPDKGGAVQRRQSWEEIGVVAAKMREEGISTSLPVLEVIP